MFKIFAYTILCLVFCFNTLIAQKIPLKILEDSLAVIGRKVLLSNTEAERYSENERFIACWKKAFEQMDAYSYAFDSVKTTTRLMAPDNDFKLITWTIPNDNGTYRYSGLIVFKEAKKDKLTVIELLDKSDKIKEPALASGNEKKWLGCVYYKIAKTTYKKKTHYILLGWDGHNKLSNRKYIESLSVNKNKELQFGIPVFKTETGTARKVVFEYSKQATMSLKYYEDKQELVFDHLSPPENSLLNQFQFYGPDFSYDCYRFDKGKWVYTKDIAPRNEKTEEKEFKKPEKTNNKNNLYQPRN